MKRFALLAAIVATPTLAQHQDHQTAQSYAGFEAREIKGLSADDIAELRAGGGWGLALPAELDGRPGPAHLLELKGSLDLDPGQVAAIEAI